MTERKIAEAMVRKLGTIGPWTFEEAKVSKKDGSSFTRFAAYATRVEKIQTKKIRRRRGNKIEQKIKAQVKLMRKTEVIVQVDKGFLLSYSYVMSSNKKGGKQIMEPDPIPIEVIEKLIELWNEAQSPIIIPGGKIIRPRARFVPAEIKKEKQ